MPAANLIVTGADDPSTFSFRDTTSTATAPPPDSDKLFNAEWDAAQQRYRAAISDRRYAESAAKDQLAALDQWKAATVASYKKRGASDDQAESLVAPDYESQKSQIQKSSEQAADQDAAAMYLDPVKSKWDILKDVPATMKRAAANELDQAHQAFQVGVNSGYKQSDAENIYLKPVEEKWKAAANISEPAKADPLAQEKQGAKIQALTNRAHATNPSDTPAEIASWFGPQKWAAMMADKAFAKEFDSALMEGQKINMRTQTAAEKAAEKAQAADEPAAVAKKLEPIYNFLTTDKYRTNAPPSLIQNLQGQRAALEKKGSAPAIGAQPPVSFQPPQEDIAATHPGLTPDQVKLVQAGKLKVSQTPPEVGEVRKGYRFKGGDPAQQKNWEKIE